MLHAPRRHRDRGAAIVEFAIVIPLLLALLFGVVDYGLWFNDSLSVRQGGGRGGQDRFRPRLVHRLFRFGDGPSRLWRAESHGDVRWYGVREGVQHG
ncbi:MAG: TadE family protein [Actinomycetales bacterium]